MDDVYFIKGAYRGGGLLVRRRSAAVLLCHTYGRGTEIAYKMPGSMSEIEGVCMGICVDLFYYGVGVIAWDLNIHALTHTQSTT